MFLFDFLKPHYCIIKLPNLPKRVQNQSGRARGKSNDKKDETKSISISITIKQSLSLNNSLWVVLVALVNIFHKMDRQWRDKSQDDVKQKEQFYTYDHLKRAIFFSRAVRHTHGDPTDPLSYAAEIFVIIGQMLQCKTIYQNKTSLSFSNRSINYLMVEKVCYS